MPPKREKSCPAGLVSNPRNTGLRSQSEKTLRWDGLYRCTTVVCRWGLISYFISIIYGPVRYPEFGCQNEYYTKLSALDRMVYSGMASSTHLRFVASVSRAAFTSVYAFLRFERRSGRASSYLNRYSILLKAYGEDVKVVQGLIRHANIATTMNVYSKALTSAKREARSRVVEVLLGHLWNVFTKRCGGCIRTNVSKVYPVFTANSLGCWVIDGPDRDRTDDLFHAIDPTLGFSTTYKTPVAP
jgi:hypothetical protein